MGKRHHNHRLAKIHRNYNVGEIANLYGIHKNTVRNWIKDGLPTIDNNRPTLILGHDIAVYLKARRMKNKHTLKAGEFYCVRCHKPKLPADEFAVYSPRTEKVGNLTAICPDCNATMNRCVSLSKIEQVRGKIDISFPEAEQHVSDRG